MSLSPEEKVVENIPGVVPEHPLQYRLDLLRHDRIECSKHTGYSPAATNWMMSSTGECRDLNSRIRYFQQRCVDVQLKIDTEGEDIERLRGVVAQSRAHDMEYVLMKRDFAQQRLEDSNESRIPRAAMLLELQGELPTIEEVGDYYWAKDRVRPTKGNLKLVEFIGKRVSKIAAEDTHHRQGFVPVGCPDTPEEYYNAVLKFKICRFLGAKLPKEYKFPQNLASMMNNQRQDFYIKFSDHMYEQACGIVADARRNGKLEPDQSKLLAFYLSGGMTGNIHYVDEHSLSHRTIGRGETLTRAEVKAWYPKKAVA